MRELPSDDDSLKQQCRAILNEFIGADLQRWLVDFDIKRDEALRRTLIPLDIRAVDFFEQQNELYRNCSEQAVSRVLDALVAAASEMAEMFSECIRNEGVGLDALDLRPAADAAAPSYTVMGDQDDGVKGDLDHASPGSSTTFMGPEEQEEEEEEVPRRRQRIPRAPEPPNVPSSTTRDATTQRSSGPETSNPPQAVGEGSSERGDGPPRSWTMLTEHSAGWTTVNGETSSQGRANRDTRVTEAVSGSASASGSGMKRRAESRGRGSEGTSKRSRQASASPPPPRDPSSPANQQASRLVDGNRMAQPPLLLRDVAPDECVFESPAARGRFFVLRCDRPGCKPNHQQQARWNGVIIFKAWPFRYRRASSHFGGPEHNLHGDHVLFYSHAREVLDAVEQQNMSLKTRVARAPAAPESKSNDGSGGGTADADTGPTTTPSATDPNHDPAYHDPTLTPQAPSVIIIDDDDDDNNGGDDYHFQPPRDDPLDAPYTARRQQATAWGRDKAYQTRLRTLIGGGSDGRSGAGVFADEATDEDGDGAGVGSVFSGSWSL